MTAASRFEYNQSLYREVHERRDALHALFVDGLPETLDMLCECSDASCRMTVKLEPASYAEIRAHPGRFIVAAGHDHSGAAVASHDGYVVIQDDEDAEP